MLTPRVIPCLLLKNGGLVKSVKFSDPKYVGDIVNAVKIFNDKEVDEIMILDVDAHLRQDAIQWKLLAEVASECFMPMGYGGGIRNAEEIRRLFELGIEKVSINTAAIENPKLIEEAAKLFGSQSIVVSIDVRRTIFGKYVVCSHGGRSKTGLDVLTHAQEMEHRGAGELLINSIDRDGTQSGYDLTLIKAVADKVNIPIVACGGAGRIQDFASAVQQGASAVAAGSLFVFHGRHRAVLITYPERSLLDKLFFNHTK